jgi:replication factor C subunit 3/5
MFLIDKYSPKNPTEIFFHKKIIQKLIVISKDVSIPHLLFYGPPGSGKKTLIRLFMEMLFGKSVNRCYDTKYNIIGSGNSPKEVIIKQSPHHIVIKPNNNNFDRYLIHDIVKKYAETNTINIIMPTKKMFKLIFISDIDSLSYFAQTSLRRTMELCSKNCKFIMLSKSLSKVISPLVSRCLSIRVNAPTDEELFKCVYKISVKENLSMNMEMKDYYKIVKNANGNIKKALWGLDMIKFNITNISTYSQTIDDIVDLIFTHGVNSIMGVRDIMYKIIITNIPCTNIIKDIIDKIICQKNITPLNKYKIITNAAKYETNLIKGRHKIIHLDAFIQSIIKILFDNSIKQ